MTEHLSKTFPEVGGILHLDHINFQVSDHDLATIFFIGGLGLTRDPFRRADETNMGVNVGLQQFHLPRRGATPPFPGLVGLIVPDLDIIRLRLTRLNKKQAEYLNIPIDIIDETTQNLSDIKWSQYFGLILQYPDKNGNINIQLSNIINDAKDNGLDEPYNDLKVGGVGNFFIRIKSGETVAIGDLVESNGDGTGKVQSDDIIRSKTVGKITSTNVIKTYSDGSFLVTAVLYAG